MMVIILSMSTKDDERVRRAVTADVPSGYDPRAYPPVAVTVDMVVLTIRAGRLQVLLIERGAKPFKGEWALPGGFVQPGEDLETAARRELAEETGVRTQAGHLEQLRSYGSPDRDPRMRVITVAYVAMMPDLPTPAAGTDAAQAHYFPVEDLDLERGRATDDGPALAFDHHAIIADALERVRAKLEYTPLATAFLEQPFTLADLRRIYESVWGVPLHPANFRRKVLSTPGFVVALGTKGEPQFEEGRAAELYRAGDAELLHPAMLRPAD
jgi:8-oxo-dGTP diphosphatase